MSIAHSVLEDLFRKMYLMRTCEESFVPHINSGEIRCPVHLYTGEEAIAAGMGANLKKEDYVFGNHRSHGHYLGKGGDLKKMVAEVFCRKTGCSQGRGGSMHLIDREAGVVGVAPIVAGTISLALGAALASSIRKDGRVTVTFFGDGATGEGVLYESMNFASIRKLPLIFACENNMYSTHLPIREIRVDVPIARVAKPFGITSYRLDGNDVVQVYESCRQAVEWCRNGNGPVFIEFLTYRFRGHVGPDDNVQGTHTDIRPAEEVEQWRANDPLPRFEKYLLDHAVMSSEKLSIIKAEIDDQVASAVMLALESDRPDRGEVNEYVFGKKA